MRLVFTALLYSSIFTTAHAETPIISAIELAREIAEATVISEGAAAGKPIDEVEVNATLSGEVAVEAEADQQRLNAQTYRIAVHEICYSELTRDAFRALTTPACAEVFEQHGIDP